MDDLIQKTEAAVRKAGAVLLAAADRERIILKGPANYVTGVDLRVQETLREDLTTIIPGSNFITEEATDNRYDFSRPTWILDPVDGTTNLLHDFPSTAVSLLLVLEGQPYLGMIYNPRLEEFFRGVTGRGAELNGRRIQVAGHQPLTECLMGFGTTPYDRDRTDRVFQTAARVFGKCRDLRRTGSAALDIAYVACGRMDGYFEMNLQPWDFGGALVILQEAGGRMTDWRGKPLGLDGPRDVLATNGFVHEEMVRLFFGFYDLD